jgi:hypothetical protein
LSTFTLPAGRLAGGFAAVLLAATGSALVAPRAAHAATDTVVTIDSHRDGEKLPVGTVRVSGTYQDAYDMRIMVNGERIDRVHTVDPENDDNGKWYYDLDTRQFDGGFQISATGTSIHSRYGTSSPWVTLNVDNPKANKPTVTVVSPADGARVNDVTPIQVNAKGRNRVERVEVRVNGGSWERAERTGDTYSYRWDPRRLGDTMVSIESRATDARGNTGYSTTTYVAAGNAKPQPVVNSQQDRALWLWEESSYNLVYNKGSRRVLESMTKDTRTFDSKPIKTIYFGVDRYYDTDMVSDLRPQVRELMSWAHANGYQVYALIAGGTRPPFLGGLERYRQHAVHEMEKVLNYNLSSAPNERFDGVNVDIEPYIFGPEYSTKSPWIQLQWLDTLRTLIDRRDASGTGLVFGPAMPIWIDGETVTWRGVTKRMSEHFQDMSDYVSLMDYRDTAAAIVRDASTEMAYADKIGKRNSVYVGVETIDLVAVGGDPAWVTFHEEGRSGEEAELAKVYAAFANSPAFGGIAMHHYDSIMDLPSVWGPHAVYPPMPSDAHPPTPVSSPPRATTVDYQGVDLRFGRAFDDTEIHHYNVYRSTRRDVTPGAETLAGQTHGHEYTDTGLLADTTYYYRVAAVDVTGKEGPASGVTSARTKTTNLRPIVVDKLQVTRDGNGVARVSLRVVDRATGAGVPASVGGRFTKSAGQYVTLPTDAGGQASGNSIPLAAPTGAVGFQIHRIVAPGYYWASGYDRAHGSDVTW